MKTSLLKQWIKIVIWTVVIFILSLILWWFDVSYLQKHPLIYISNYSEMVLEIWATQATIASLTLASTAFILAKIEDVYYGISVKDLLHSPKRLPCITLSFWAKNICSIIIPAATLFFVVIDNMTAVIFMFLFTVYLAITILYDCIAVITKSEIYSNWAKQEIDKLVEKITYDDKKTDQKQKVAAQKQLSEIIDGIHNEISLKIAKNTSLIENDTYLFFISLMDRYTDEFMSQINEQMHSILIDWLVLSINVKSESNTRTLLRCSYPKSLDSRYGAAGINVFMSSYYNGDISNSLFENEIENISKAILQATDDYSAKALYVLRNAVNYADEKTFVRILKAVWRSQPYDNPRMRANVITTAIVYLYYMAYKEQYMPIEKGYKYVEKLRTFSIATFLETYSDNGPKQLKDILTDTDLILDGAGFLLSYFNDRAFNWEYISLETGKIARLGKDTVEFLAFYCCLFLQQVDAEVFESISLDILLKIKVYFNDDGYIDKKYSRDYSLFCDWTGVEMIIPQKNDEFYSSLIEAIKKKMFVEAKAIRDKQDVWYGKISIAKDEIVKHLSKSNFYMKGELAKDSYVMFRLSEFRLLKYFSEGYAYFGNEQFLQKEIENYLFSQLCQHNILESCPVHREYKYFENDVLAFSDMLDKMSNRDISIDEFYNYPFFKCFSHREKSNMLSEKINKINTNLKNVGNWKTYYSGVTMYVDSSIDKVGFWLPKKDFIEITEKLTESELKYISKKYKTEQGYIFKEASNGVEIPFSEDELIEYLRIALVKVRYVIPLQLPRRRIGFYTYIVQ